ncbi:MAG TPA: hypothetical protein VIN10_01870 [Bacteroidales bacterium]
MKKQLYLFLLSSFILAPFYCPAQGFYPPSSGKAVIYFVQVTSYGSTVFEFFHYDRYIGYMKGKDYIRYECEPGENLFWASSENKEFLTADLKAGGTYLVIVDVVTGFWKNHVGFTPISENDTELFKRAKKVILNEPPFVTPQAKIEKENKKLQKFIAEELEHYENETKNKYNFRHISADMALSASAMK